jgi:hypothetical protein
VFNITANHRTLRYCNRTARAINKKEGVLDKFFLVASVSTGREFDCEVTAGQYLATVYVPGNDSGGCGCPGVASFVP